MARKKKDVGPILNEGDIVILYSQIGPAGDVVGVGAIERIKPLAGNPDEDMVWVPGFAAHHPDAVKRIGSPQELIGRLHVMEAELTKKDQELDKSKKELSQIKSRLDSVVKFINKATGLVTEMNGTDLLDAKAVVKWIKDAKAKYSNTASKRDKASPSITPQDQQTI